MKKNLQDTSEGFTFILHMSIPTDHRKVFFVIPAYNENTVIRSVIEGLLPFNYQLIVIDDGSENPLFPVIENLPVIFLRHPVNLGQGAALQTGIEYALSKKADYIVTFDADGQHKASDIEKLLLPLENNEADICLGSRFIKDAQHNMPFARKLIIQTARFLNYCLTGIMLTDAHNGLRAMTRKAGSAIQIRENGMAHATELLTQIKKNKLRYKEVPVSIHYTDYSRKKGQSLWSSFRIFFDLILNKIFK
jgi:glycosyltransferase involved in cell wall biosynthesis